MKRMRAGCNGTSGCGSRFLEATAKIIYEVGLCKSRYTLSVSTLQTLCTGRL
jgi:hypothetical protein